MAVLFVAGEPPWPVASGNAQRMHHVITGLSSVMEVDVVNFTDPWRKPPDGPPVPGVRRWLQSDRPPVARFHRWFDALGPARKPLALAGRRVGPAANFTLLDDRYDIVWVHRAETFALLEGQLPAGPRVVDLVDLEDYKLSARAKTLEEPVAPKRVDPLRRARASLARRDAASWRRLQARVSRRIERLVVTCQLDANRLDGLTQAPVFVIPNGADDPGSPASRTARDASHTPTVVFFGLLTYPPNVDAAIFLARRVGPELRRRVPGLKIRMVGRASDRVKALHSPPEVEVTDFVEDLSAELAGADIAIVPIRYGGGTRIKILDAWAHGLPVVSTSAGAEGLEARDGDDIMLADSADSLAVACAGVLTDPNLAASLARNGRQRFEDSYRWSEIEAAVTSLARRLVEESRRKVTNP